MSELKPTRSTTFRRDLIGGIGLIIAGMLFSGFSSQNLNLFSTLMIIGGLWLLGSNLYSWYTHSRVGTPEVTLSKTAVSVGEQFTFSILNTFKQNVTLNSFMIHLIFKETATYQQGTNTRTVTHEEIVDSFEGVGGSFSQGSFLSEEVTFTIPADGMHSLNVPRNKLQWLVRVEMDIPRLKKFEESYEIKVEPQLAKPTSWS